MRGIRVHLLVLTSLCLFSLTNGAAPKPAKADPGKTASVTLYPSPYYNVYTDLPAEEAKEVVIRMTRMAEEYHERTKALFSGSISQKLPFYLYANEDEYYAAGGMAGSAGVFMVDSRAGDRLMAAAIRNQEGKVGRMTWHVVQHEGFHQFVHYVVRGDIPVWVNEGMAEYFGEGLWTGDGMQTGLISQSRMKIVQELITNKKLKSAKAMMLLTHAQWNADLDVTNYDQAWSMVHFLAHGDNGKYQDAFARFMQDIGRGKQWERAWEDQFGSANGFEEKWQQYWLTLPDNPTIDLFAKAAVATLTSYLGRAHTQKQGFDNFEEMTKTDPAAMKMAPGDWLPASLLAENMGRAQKLESIGFKFAVVNEPKKLPQIVCTTPSGGKIVGSFLMTNGGSRIGKVTVEMPKPLPPPKAAADSAKK